MLIRVKITITISFPIMKIIFKYEVYERYCHYIRDLNCQEINTDYSEINVTFTPILRYKSLLAVIIRCHHQLKI